MIGGMAMKGFVLIAVAILSACRSAGAGTPPTTTVTPPAAAPAAADRDPDSIRWVRDSAEYYAAVLQVYRHAAARVESEARARTAGTWAVVLDADETVISNLTYQIERARLGLAFSPESWNAWVKRREATPLPGAAAFLSRVRDLGGRIAIVTNRLESECEDTAAVFRAHALVFDAMLCRPNGSPSDKNPRFDAVAAGKTTAGSTPLELLAVVGDNIQDFPRLTQKVRQAGDAAFVEFGARYFVVPNPMYGSWQSP
jgi:5'-nucleotidase (lipoprotein e(P4) family)